MGWWGIRSTCGGGIIGAHVVVGSIMSMSGGGNLRSTCGGGVLGACVVVGYSVERSDVTR